MLNVRILIARLDQFSSLSIIDNPQSANLLVLGRHFCIFLGILHTASPCLVSMIIRAIRESYSTLLRCGRYDNSVDRENVNRAILHKQRKLEWATCRRRNARSFALLRMTNLKFGSTGPQPHAKKAGLHSTRFWLAQGRLSTPLRGVYPERSRRGRDDNSSEMLRVLGWPRACASGAGISA